MLVLSRRMNEKIVFPGINAIVQVLALKAGQVRLGIDAPNDVKVLRAELHDLAKEWGPSKEAGDDGVVQLRQRIRDLNRLIRKRLDGAGVGLSVLGRQLRAGLTQDAETTLDKLGEDLKMLLERLEREAGKVDVLPAPLARKSRALLVEDNANECELLATFLRMADVDVATAGDGAAALDYLHGRGRPDVVLLDMGLPICDGPTTVRAIRQDPALAGMKIFAVTGHSPSEYDVAIGPAGVDRWFSKPLDPRALLLDLQGA